MIKASLPGVKAKDLNISVTGDVLTLRGEVQEEKETEGAQYHLKERRSGSFTRSITLPAAVVADKADARFDDGILTLRLPRAEEVKPKTLTVKAKSNSPVSSERPAQQPHPPGGAFRALWGNLHWIRMPPA
jgi:HSP20 family protein